MQWSKVCWVLMSIIVIASSGVGLRHKRSLSFLTRLFSNNMERGRARCTNLHRIPLKEYEILVVPDGENVLVETIPEITSKRTTRRKNNNVLLNSVQHFLGSGTFQATSGAIGEIITNFLAGGLSEETNSIIDAKTHTPNKIASHKVTVDHKSIVTTIPKNVITVDEIVYERPQTYSIPLKSNFMSSIISIPRKYSYEQIKDETVQTHSLDNSSDVIVKETRKKLPRPAYVDDRIKDVILGVPPYGRQLYSSIAIEPYRVATVKPNVIFSQQHEKHDIKIFPNNHISMYSGEPIVVDDERPKIIDPNIKEKLRGDI